MVLLIVAVVGFVLGYRLGMTPRGFVTLAVISLGASAIQVGHLLSTATRSSMTMLPMVVGAVAVAGLLVGALARRTLRRSIEIS